ncbi:MAG: ATP-binding cassette domain-containing protein [Bacteroidota bacterium]
MLSVHSVTKSYGSQLVLDNISFDIETGTSLAIIGPSGCGKSTLLRVLMGLIAPDSGTVSIEGQKLQAEYLLEMRTRIGYVIQRGGLFPHLTARANVTLMARYLDWDKERVSRRVEDLASLVKIRSAELDRYPSELSGGQVQRIGLMRALMLDPALILLDEPLGSIDPLVRYELQNQLKDIFSTLKKTVALVTHDLNEAAFLGDEILLMNEGRIIQKGRIDVLKEQPADAFVSSFIEAHRGVL